MRTLRRLFRHLTRARVGWMGVLILAAILVLNFGLLSAQSGSRRVLEIVLGTAVSLALLPDEPFRIWNLRSKVLAETVPTDKLHHVAQEVVAALALQTDGAVSSDDVAMLWRTFSSDVKQILDEPTRLVRDLSYRITVSKDGTASGAKRLATEIDSVRYSNVDVPVQVTICSDVASLEKEFTRQDPGCVLREMVPFRTGEASEAWIARVTAGIRAIIVDGVNCQLTEQNSVDYGEQRSIAVRATFSGNLRKDGQVRTVVRTEFVTDSLQEFAIRFSSYYCIGSTRIFFELRDTATEFVVHNFLAMGFGEYELTPHSESGSHTVSVTTNDQSVLAPGSGLLISWSASQGGM